MTVAWYISGSKCVSLVKLRQNFVRFYDVDVNDKSRVADELHPLQLSGWFV